MSLRSIEHCWIPEATNLPEHGTKSVPFISFKFPRDMTEMLLSSSAPLFAPHVLITTSGMTTRNIANDVHPNHLRNLKYKEIPTP